MPVPPAYKPPTPPVWATYIEDRMPQFKTHNNRGQALNAVQYVFSQGVRGGIIYRLVNEAWQEWLDVPKGMKKKDVQLPPDITCGKCKQGEVIDKEDYLCPSCRKAATP